MIKIYFLIIFLNIFYAQGLSDYSYNSAESSSLAGSIVSVKGGSWSLFNNPATLVEVENNILSVGYGNLYNQKYLPMSSFGVIISNYNINFGIKYNSFKVSYEGTKLLSDDEIGFVTALKLLKDKQSSLSLGLSANYYIITFAASSGASGDGSDGIDGGSVSSLGFDLGLLATLRDKNRLGVFIKNINSPMIGRGVSNQNLPQKIDVGFSTMPSEYLMVTLSLEQLLGSINTQFKTSIKYQITKELCFNTGVQMNPNRFGIGFTFNTKLISISYGYLTHPILPQTHQCNIGIEF
tara:strand:- start:956 stop:1837 length:882 start_codon:yes stop_codon:yes gene_type:complete